ncbi:M56 family metallopeptidase [Spirosoma fluviale]|uniref:Signal transducer regulating beta-lactamase production, contains metallopeptidase domain n=1 Tax=Spirosoma fluviale TaxID=1597977 RepID=A0A286GNM1_9BACT|nr:M56 family metallopeptidase [Spirosoma fluviale]SOD97145.1 Signal transducer regulating beta-lactamase production, contains metallopeptidase domain [Spirosoma fluviale]
MNHFKFLTSPVADALGWTLLHAIWQGFALVLPVAVVLHLLRNRSSALRYQISTLTLLAQLLVSAATFAWYYEPLVSSGSSKPMAVAMQTLPIRWQAMAQTLPWPQQLQLFLENHLSQFVFVYLLGVALFGLRLAGGWLYLQRLTKTATEPTSAVWMQLTNRLRSTLAIRGAVQVRESARISVPMVVGILKPILLLPVSLVTQLTTREIEAVLAHELAHIKRHDYAVNLLQSVVEVLYFFHPALWWLSARVREEREHCCDDLAVLACGGDGRILAQALAHVEELRLRQQTAAPALAMAFAGKRQHLLHRVRRMLGVPTRPFVSNGSLAGLTLATILLMSVSVYAVQEQAQPKPKPKTSQPHPTRKHKAGNGTEFSITDNRKVDYIIWKGKKLPAKQVAQLQRQFDQVMAGQLNLDDVKQPNRDILLTIIETDYGHTQGMNALAEGLANIDYSNIVASALTNVPLSPDGTVEGLARVNYDSIINSALASLPALNALPDSLDKLNRLNQHLFNTDSLPEEFQNKFLELKLKYDQVATQLTEHEKAMERYIAMMEEPSKQRRHMDLEQRKLQEEIAYMKKQASRSDFRAINDALSAQIATAERNLSEARKRMKELTRREISPYSDSLSKAFKRLTRLRDSIRINEGELLNIAPVPPIPPATPAAPSVGVPVPLPAPAAPAVKALRGRATPSAVPKPPKPAKAPKADWPKKPELPEKPD